MAEKTANTRRVLITGASGGIGLELARLFAADGWELALAARNAATLAEVAADLSAKYGARVEVFPTDLSQVGAPEQLFAAVTRDDRPIAALVNNAGFGLYGLFAGMDLAQIQALMQLNMATLTTLTRLALPAMISNRSGYVLNVASAAAFQPGPLMAAYFASKAYVLHLTEAIAEEARSAGVRVTALCPGPTETGFARRAAAEDVALFQGSILTAEGVARKGYRGLMRGKRIVIPGLKFKILLAAQKFAPRSLVTKIAMQMQARKH